MAEILLSESHVTSTDLEKSDGANPGVDLAKRRPAHFFVAGGNGLPDDRRHDWRLRRRVACAGPAGSARVGVGFYWIRFECRRSSCDLE